VPDRVGGHLVDGQHETFDGLGRYRVDRQGGGQPVPQVRDGCGSEPPRRQHGNRWLSEASDAGGDGRVTDGEGCAHDEVGRWDGLKPVPYTNATLSTPRRPTRRG